MVIIQYSAKISGDYSFCFFISTDNKNFSDHYGFNSKRIQFYEEAISFKLGDTYEP